MPAQPQTFDEWAHLLTLNGFYDSISQFSIPVSWVDTVSNYGSPLGQISHQLTAYISAVFFAITKNTVLSYNLTLLIGSMLGTFLMYRFLRLYFSPLSSLAATILYTFAPYRIANIYIRGALPEFFASAFIPLIAIGIHIAFFRKKLSGLLYIFLGSALLALTHPMMIVLGFSLVLIYLLYVVFSLSNFKAQFKTIILFGVCSILGVLISSYYLLPLTLEIKYFHQGQIGTSQDTYWFLDIDAFTKEVWNYYSFDTVGIRENRLQLGILEGIVIVAGAILLLYKKWKKQSTPTILWWWLVATAVFIFLMSPASTFLYQHISILAGIQFPWRFLIVLICIAPFFLAYILDTLKYKRILCFLVILSIALLRFPHLYGKNYINFPQSRYDFTTVNPHSVNLNTTWSGKSSEYPIKKEKVAVIEGEGTISTLVSSPTFRKYTMDAQTAVRVIDYTFYFPGWNVYINRTPIEIIYQDPDYRGIITYSLPQGNYSVEMIYENTKIRLFGKILSVSSFFIAISCILYYLHISKKQKNELEQKILGTIS